MDYCKMVVAYSRTRMIGNEAQCLALTLSMLTAYAPSAKEYTSTGIVGELSSGKTLTVNVVLGEYTDGEMGPTNLLGLFPQTHIHRITSATSKALIYSDALREPEFGMKDSPIRIIYAAEYQKLSDDVIEYFKSQSGDDPKFVYEYTDVTTKSTRRIKQKKRVFVFTYAQASMDPELESRIIRFAVDENKLINKCVIQIQHGTPFVEYKGFRYTLEGDEELEREIKDQISMIAGGKEINVINPFFLALSDLEDCSRASSKRVSGMIEALFKSSARLNFTEREVTEDGTVLMSAQDLVNVLSLTDIIQSMILEIDVIDLAIIRFLGVSGKSADQIRIISYLSKSGLPELTQTEFVRRVKGLVELNYVIEWQAEGEGKANKKTWYKLNPNKYIHPITVHWGEVYKIDQSPVENPITGERFSDIREFGESFDALIRRGLEIHFEGAEDHIPTFEETVFASVQRLISHGNQYKLADASRLRRDCMVELGQTSITDHERFENALNDLLKTGMIDLDPVSETFVVLDPSVKANLFKRTTTTKSLFESEDKAVN